MKKTSINMGKFIKVLGLALSLAAVPLLVGVTGCTTTANNPDQTKGQRIDDQATSSRVEDALAADPLYKFSGVSVDTWNGTVQLSGFVTASEQKTRAGELARNSVGVREVVNNITVKEPANIRDQSQVTP